MFGMSHASGGTHTALCALVAETLGLPMEDVEVGELGNTASSARGGVQAGSTRTCTLGAAFVAAAEDAKKELFACAATLLKVSADELDARDGNIFVKADPAKSVTHAQATATTGRDPPPIIGKGYT